MIGWITARRRARREAALAEIVRQQQAEGHRQEAARLEERARQMRVAATGFARNSPMRRRLELLAAGSEEVAASRRALANGDTKLAELHEAEAGWFAARAAQYLATSRGEPVEVRL
ncbi:MAG: hypothetical protein K2X74_00590 [Acetobacteraceae bacterium]|nr:hypothetical protein [Acetobacteraceae bacterium]